MSIWDFLDSVRLRDFYFVNKELRRETLEKEMKNCTIKNQLHVSLSERGAVTLWRDPYGQVGCKQDNRVKLVKKCDCFSQRVVDSNLDSFSFYSMLCRRYIRRSSFGGPWVTVAIKCSD